MKLTRRSWVATFVAIALVIGCYFLFRGKVLSESVAIALMIMFLVSVIWLSPYILSFQAAAAKTRGPDEAS
jgi:hypothetical protein